MNTKQNFFLTRSKVENESKAIDYIHYPEGHSWEKILAFTKIVIVLEGSFLISYDHFIGRKISKGKILLLPPGCQFTARTEEGMSGFIFRLKEFIRFCDGLSFENIIQTKQGFIYDLNCLDINNSLYSFFTSLKEHMENGLREESFLNIKNEELMYLLRAYYSWQELSPVFYPLLSNNARFTNFILRNYREVKTVRELAERYNCSISSFDKKFREAFGTSTYQWMQKKKISLLYHEINTTDKPFKQIAEEQKFLSLPQFNDYCKKHFGYPPGKMRKLSLLFRQE